METNQVYKKKNPLLQMDQGKFYSIFKLLE
uniref:Uncharacterized protein n=1 Tax=Siphoviridae sp. ctiam3 TaxID=2825624 RepID=A0A8S5P4K2_9CAUD|nr:MAG TPA: hypothetical protein [Siphoviridae sp. ctiam3]